MNEVTELNIPTINLDRELTAEERQQLKDSFGAGGLGKPVILPARATIKPALTFVTTFLGKRLFANCTEAEADMINEAVQRFCGIKPDQVWSRQEMDLHGGCK